MHKVEAVHAMITPQLTLPLHREIFIDNFAGGGGASTGIERALGRFVDEALNHNREALAMHRMNHPQTMHHCEDIRTADPVTIAKGRPVGGIWFSPDCKHFSKAKGGKPLSKNIRGLAWVVINWINKVSPRVIFLENVEEFQTWCPITPEGKASAWRKGWFFRCFVGALRRRGYAVEWRELRACDYGAPTIRKRFFLIARRDGQPITWPLATHGPTLKKKHRAIAECLDFSLPCASVFLSKEEGRKVRAVRPLAAATMARIAKGVDRYVLKAKRPFIVSLTHQGGDRVESIDEPSRTITCARRGEKALVSPVIANTANSKTTGRGPNVWSVEDPARTITTSPGFCVISPVIAHAQHGGAVRSAGDPLHTIAASPKDQNQVIAVHLTKFNTGAIGASVEDPSPTITANSFIKRPGGAVPLGVVAVHMAQHNTGVIGHAVDEPASTLSSKGSQQQLVAASLIKFYGTDQDPRMTEPAHTVTTKDRFALNEMTCAAPPLTAEQIAGAKRVAAFLRAHGVEFAGEFATVGEHVIIDIGMRMLRPRELYLAQGFPPGYIIARGLDELADGRLVEIALTGTAQVRMVGNSVCPPLSEAIVAANLPDMREERRAA